MSLLVLLLKYHRDNPLKSMLFIFLCSMFYGVPFFFFFCEPCDPGFFSWVAISKLYVFVLIFSNTMNCKQSSCLWDIGWCESNCKYQSFHECTTGQSSI